MHERVRGGARDDVRLDGLGRQQRRLGPFLFRRVGVKWPKDGCIWMGEGHGQPFRPWETRSREDAQ
jgi:hypothetical protein